MGNKYKYETFYKTFYQAGNFFDFYCGYGWNCYLLLDY